MPKNVKGGSGHRSQAHKNTSGGGGKSGGKTRLALDEYELYAQVTSLSGNRMCRVLCQDEKIRVCHIRGKFCGKGKRDNTIVNGSWVLVGLRDFETQHDSNVSANAKLDKCDLLELYNERDKSVLKSEVNLSCWSKFLSNDNSNSHYETSELDGFVFSNNAEDEYKKLMETDLMGEAPKKILLPSLSASAVATAGKLVEDGDEDNSDDFDIYDI